MIQVVYRDAPPLLQRARGGGVVKLFDDHFRPGSQPIVFTGLHGRQSSFEGQIGRFQDFFKGRPGSPEQRFIWIEDTLRRPDRIWRLEENTATIELFESRYQHDDHRWIYVIKVQVLNESLSVRPYAAMILEAQHEHRWSAITSSADLVWPPPKCEEIEISAEELNDTELLKECPPAAELLGENGKLLIVGPLRDQLDAWISARDNVVIWPSTEMKGQLPEVPYRTRYILVTKFANHGVYSDPLSAWGRKNSVPVRFVSFAQIRAHCRPWEPLTDRDQRLRGRAP